MLDLNNIPSGSKADIQTFYANGASWQVWNKPRGATMAHMLCLGGGGGGGGGSSSAAGSGGTGGGSCAPSTLLIPTAFLPDQLFILVGLGGAGGAGALNAAGSPGFQGGNSVIGVMPDPNLMVEIVGTGMTFTATPTVTLPDTSRLTAGMYTVYATGNGTGGPNTNPFIASILNSTQITLGANAFSGSSGTTSVYRLFVSQAIVLTSNGGTGGPGGTTGVGTAGTAATAVVIGQCGLAGIGKYNFFAGQAGTAGNDVNNTGTAQTFATTGICVQGGSGGGAPTGGTATGVAITAAGLYPGVAAQAGVGVDGIPLQSSRLPMFFMGGSGGGGGATSFTGGKGSYGCGGGGAGGVPAAATSVAGGAGGDGLVRIICW